MPGSQQLKHPDLDADQVRVKDAHQLVSRTGRIRQRPEDIEDRAHPELPADWRNVFHGAMVCLRKHEADADVGDAFSNLLGRKREVCPERLKDIGAARR